MCLQITCITRPIYSRVNFITRDGRIVYPVEDRSGSTLGILNAAFVFDTNTRTGSMQPLSNQTAYPPAKYGANAVLGKPDKAYVCIMSHLLV